MTLALLLGLGAAVAWGTADFFAGLQSRRLDSLRVALWSQLCGGVALGGALLVTGGAPRLAGFEWGIAAGVAGAAALVVYYRGLAIGAMSIVAPVSACGAILPVLVALARGETPGTLALVGMALAVAGIVVVSLPGQHSPHPSGKPLEVMLLSVGAALGIGFIYVFLDLGIAQPDANPLWVVTGGRVGSVLSVLLFAGGTRRSVAWPGWGLAGLAPVGLLDVGANVAFAYAASLGNLGVVSVLASLYPVATVVLAGWLLAERLRWRQWSGVLLALAGVVLLAAG